MTDRLILDTDLFNEMLLEVPYLRGWEPILHRPPAVHSRVEVERADPDALVVRPDDIQRDEFAGTIRVTTARAWLVSGAGLRFIPTAEQPVRLFTVPGDLLLLTESLGATATGLEVLYRILPLAPSHDEARRMETRASAREIAYRIGLSPGTDAVDPARRDLRGLLDNLLGTERAAMHAVLQQVPTQPPGAVSPQPAADDSLFDDGPRPAPPPKKPHPHTGDVTQSLGMFEPAPAATSMSLQQPETADPVELLLDRLGALRRDGAPSTLEAASKVESDLRRIQRNVSLGLADDQELAAVVQSATATITALESNKHE